MSDPKEPAPPDDDPIEQSLEEAALERARAHLAELDAEARLTEDVAVDPAAPTAPARPVPTREEADAEALAEFQRLRDRVSKKTL